MQIGQIAIQQAITPLFGKDISQTIASKSPSSDSASWRTLEQEIDSAIEMGKSELSKKISTALQRYERLDDIALRAAKDAEAAHQEYERLCDQLFKIECHEDE